MSDYDFNTDDFDIEKISDLNREFDMDTSCLSTIIQACSEAQEFSRMTAILADPGVGKSQALEYYAKRNKNVYYINNMLMSPKDLFGVILKSIGFKNMHRETNIYHLIDSIVYYLSESPGKHLIILDEAGRLTHKTLLHLHDLRNALMKNTGIILAAPGYFRTDIYRDAEAQMIGIPEFKRRILNWIEIEPPSYEEKYAFCLHSGVLNKQLIHELCIDNTTYPTMAELKNFINENGLIVNRLQREKERKNPSKDDLN